GNFHADRSYVFYGDRAQNDITTTNLPTDGGLTGFSPYWSFNESGDFIADTLNLKWVWNSEATRYNAKGMELETRNALNIYTAAQYGYHKSLPVAIAQNARYGETMYAGFEDERYQASLN